MENSHQNLIVSVISTSKLSNTSPARTVPYSSKTISKSEISKINLNLFQLLTSSAIEFSEEVRSIDTIGNHGRIK